MIKINKHIEIVSSAKSWLSSMSQESREAIFAVLSKHYSSVEITLVNDVSDLEALVARKPDLVFLGMEFVADDRVSSVQEASTIWLSDYLDAHGIAHTGSGKMAHELGRSKPLAKKRVLDAGFKTSPFYVAGQNETVHDTHLAFPLFVKPTNRGGGRGIDSNSVVHNFDQLQSKVRSIAINLQSDSLIEEYLPGREFSVAILQDENSAELLVMPIELIAPMNERGARLLSGQVKSANSEQALVVTDTIIKSQITALAIDVFYALGARDYGRIDIRLDENNIPHFLEANLIPSLISNYGSFPKACMLNATIDYESMILRIVRLGLMRNLDIHEDTIESIALHKSVLSSFETSLNPAV
jgi:D-alanine-D-alanine ligase